MHAHTHAPTATPPYPTQPPAHPPTRPRQEFAKSKANVVVAGTLALLGINLVGNAAADYYYQRQVGECGGGGHCLVEVVEKGTMSAGCSVT